MEWKYHLSLIYLAVDKMHITFVKYRRRHYIVYGKKRGMGLNLGWGGSEHPLEIANMCGRTS